MDETLNLRKREIAKYNKTRRERAKDHNAKLKKNNFVSQDTWELVTGWVWREESTEKKERDKYLNKFEYYRGDLERVRT